MYNSLCVLKAQETKSSSDFLNFILRKKLAMLKSVRRAKLAVTEAHH